MGFGKVIAIRFKRFTKKGHIQHNSTTTAHPVPATSEPGLEASANVSFATSSEGVSLVRKAYDMAQVALPLVQAVAGAIPLVGAPMQAAIGGLLIGLQAIDRHSQNKSDLDSLTLRLNRLCLDLCNAPQAWDPVEQLRRDSFVRMLKDTSARVTTLHERCFASTSVTQAIAGCFIEIDRYLAEYLWLSQIQSQRDTHEVLVILRREQEDRQKFLTTIESIVMRGQSSVGPSASHLGGTVALGCITLVDATGHHHAISVNCCTSFQQLNDMLRVLFQRDVIEAQIQRWYIETGQYDLCIDEGTQVTPLTSCGWSSIEPGTKIVMRVIIEQQEPSSSEVDYQCHFCGAVNHLGAQAACSINCRVCNRRFQISCEPAKFHLIRNFHVQQTDSRCRWVDEITHQTCHAWVQAGLQPMLSHLNTVHNIRGSEKNPTECKWAVLRSGYKSACGMTCQRRNIPRHLAKHLGLRWLCKLCGTTFARPDLLRYHKRKNH